MIRKAEITKDEFKEWERLCKERNLNPNFSHLSTYEFLLDIMKRLEKIEKKLY